MTTKDYSSYVAVYSDNILKNTSNGKLIGTIDDKSKLVFLLDIFMDNGALSGGLSVIGEFIKDEDLLVNPDFINPDSQIVVIKKENLIFNACGKEISSKFIEKIKFFEYFFQHNLVFRIKDKISIGFSNQQEFQKIKNQIKEKISDSNSTFHIPDFHENIFSENNKITVGQLKGTSAQKSVIGQVIPTIIPLSILIGPSKNSNDAPYMVYESHKKKSRDLDFDVVVYASNSEHLSRVFLRLKEEFCRQVDLLADCLENNSKFDKAGVFHFGIPNWKTRFVTCIYPIDPISQNEDYLMTMRREYHRVYALPMDRPLLRIVDALTFSEYKKADRLSNVHLGLNSPGGTPYLISGNYDYYHYTQDMTDDTGWGCAYRSLQTIESWFIEQGYTTKRVQTHKEIQKMLYAMGQRTRGFIGSREWIGSLEIQAVLQAYLGIVSKIIHVQKGPEIIEHTKRLVDHFSTQGTPIMIGGGQLAFTLLGVSVNPTNQKMMLLILDPHYTGKDDLKTIQNKGWCSWKDVGTIFKEKYFYNLCLPQLPGGVGERI